MYFCLDKNKENLNGIDILRKEVTDDSIMMDLTKEKFESIIPQIIFGPHSKETEQQEIKKKLKEMGYEKITCIQSNCPLKEDKILSCLDSQKCLGKDSGA